MWLYVPSPNIIVIFLCLLQTYLLTATHLPRSLRPLRSSEVGVIKAEVSEDDPSNVILATEAGCIAMTDLNSEMTLVSVATNDQEQVKQILD